ncbi:hypothetical protein BCU71_06520 [Vibrio lentus]|uniref:sulfotransferase family 2 domain-containing protein n=1 Tax=Vibrio lentus TaxID=136468 RepID=UPI000C8606C5|nr:sulfotransferase family 2 domain-containing protein [Vibrio lentus]PMH28220.1 hypothetical protein BCU71_06520 [Vibrio lentus]PMK70201.1 hypothetical protein BCT93_06155 [Vibrio lentus]
MKGLIKEIIPEGLKRYYRINMRNIYRPYYLENDVIYIHIPKAGGQSISYALFGDTHPGHTKLTEFQRKSSEKYERFYKFTFVRCPYSRLQSAYYYLKYNSTYSTDREFYDDNLSKFKDFKDFVINGLKMKEVISWVHFVPQYKFLVNENDEVDMDFIGKFENINDDFEIISEKLGVKSELLKRNISKNKKKLEFDEEMISIVNDVYSRDFMELGYVQR